jgi:hypothetical protein
MEVGIKRVDSPEKLPPLNTGVGNVQQEILRLKEASVYAYQGNCLAIHLPKGFTLESPKELPPLNTGVGNVQQEIWASRAAMNSVWWAGVASPSSGLRLFSSRRKVWPTGAAATRDCSSEVS